MPPLRSSGSTHRLLCVSFRSTGQGITPSPVGHSLRDVGKGGSLTVLISTTINGRPAEFQVDVFDALVDILREAGYTGVKVNCRLGECGVCTVLLDGKPVHGCLTMAVHANGREIMTIEGQVDDVAREIQAKMASHQGLQCGYCTPGMVTSLVALMKSHSGGLASVSRSDIKAAIAGNLCRCTGYEQILEAAEDALHSLLNR